MLWPGWSGPRVTGITLQNIRSVGRLRTPAQRHDLFGLPTRPAASAAFIFPASTGWRQSLQFHGRAGLAAFLRRSGPARDILAALRDGKPPDFSRGFSSRPQSRGSTELAGTGYSDGWGAHCIGLHAGAADTTRAFVPGPVPAAACEVSGQSDGDVFCAGSRIFSIPFEYGGPPRFAALKSF